jgi:alpha-mannosidase
MVKAVFPVDINTDKATFDVQFGTVERPTHFNTSWDRAKFETCAHKYVDISDGSYGVSLMNDCKYGHDVHDGVIMISLFKSPTYPTTTPIRARSSLLIRSIPTRADLPKAIPCAARISLTIL